MCGRLGNYDISTETRGLEIQWIKVQLLVHAGKEPKAEIPPPFDKIKFSQGGTILGKATYIPRKKDKSSEARIRKRNKYMETCEPRDLPK